MSHLGLLGIPSSILTTTYLWYCWIAHLCFQVAFASDFIVAFCYFFFWISNNNISLRLEDVVLIIYLIRHPLLEEATAHGSVDCSQWLSVFNSLTVKMAKSLLDDVPAMNRQEEWKEIFFIGHWKLIVKGQIYHYDGNRDNNNCLRTHWVRMVAYFRIKGVRWPNQGMVAYSAYSHMVYTSLSDLGNEIVIQATSHKGQTIWEMWVAILIHQLSKIHFKRNQAMHPM